jgi:UDP:flavonoid glycosyltransferase YjiC (YdhE family)
MNVLFTSWGNPGNLSPLLTAARRVRERGHHVRILGEVANQEETLRAGFECRSWTRAKPLSPPSDLGLDPLWDEIRMFVEQLMFGTALDYALDTVDELRGRPTDVLVTSDFIAGPTIAAEALGIPYALLVPHISIRPLDGVPAPASGLAPCSDPASYLQEQAQRARLLGLLDGSIYLLNRARAEFSLPPIACGVDYYDRADRVLIGLSPAFDFPATRLPSNVRYVGPLLDAPAWSRPWVAPWSGQAMRPHVLVSLSTSFQNQAGLLGRIITVLATMDVDAVVTAGPAVDRDALPRASNVSVVHSAPHDAVMKEVSLVITHGGHGTVTRALLNGLPLLVIPMGRDQADNAARVVARGAGLTLGDDATANEIAVAVGRLVREEAFQASAAALGQQIAMDFDLPVLVDELEAIGQRRWRLTA